MTAEGTAPAQHSREVCVHDLFPLGVRDVERRTPHGDACGVYQDVDLAELLDRRVRERLDGFGVPDVRGYRERAASATFDLTHHFMDEIRTATGRDYIRTRVGEAERDGFADARRSADDGGSASVEIETRKCHDS